MYFNHKTVLYHEATGMINSFYENEASGYCFTITMRDTLMNGADCFEMYYRNSQPCYGELRKYAETHEGCTAPEEKPSDLFDPFPFSGKAYRITAGYSIQKEKEKEQLEFMNYLLLESPMSKAIYNKKDALVLKHGNQKYSFAFSAEADPTVLVNMFKNCQSWLNGSGLNRWLKLVDYGLTKDQALFALMFLSTSSSPYNDDCEDDLDWDYSETCDCEVCQAMRAEAEGEKKEGEKEKKKKISFVNTSEYVNTNYPSPKNFFAGVFNKLSHDGDTWAEGGSYSRRKMDKSWECGETKLYDSGQIFGADSIAKWAQKQLPDEKMTEAEAYRKIFSVIEEYDNYLDSLFKKEDVVVDEKQPKKKVAKKINLLEKA